MTSPAPRNQRQSFRCPASGPRQEAMLKAGDVRLPARVLDESAGGFAIAVAGSAGLNAGDVAQLRTAAGWFEVRVSNVAASEASPPESLAVQSSQPAGEEAAEPPEQIAAFRLGLQRLREIDAPDEEQRNRARGWLRFPMTRAFAQVLPSQHSMLAFGAVFALAIIGVPLLAVAFLWHGDRPLVKTLAQWGENALTAVVGNSEPQEPAAGTGTPSSEFNSTPSDSSAGASLQETLRRNVRRLPGVMAFVLPEVMQFLGLTDPQWEQIRQIDEAAVRSLQDLDRQWRGGSRRELTQQRMAVLDDARRQAIETLTDQQRARWQELLDEEP